jgi:anti-sigma regulatory factor (Ser/Thr protein kinase)
MLCLRYHKTDSEQEAHHEEETLSISNKLEQVSQLPDFIESYCSTLPVPPSLILSLNLAIEEAMVNCVQYAYPAGTEGDISLSVHWNDLHHELTFVLRDAGMPFDPTAVPAPDVSLGVEERPIGGLGILLVRKIMDTVSYSRENDQNVLTMSKKIYAHTTS